MPYPYNFGFPLEMDFCLRCGLTCRCDLNAWAELLKAWLALTIG